jgi:hypothetical protein
VRIDVSGVAGGEVRTHTTIAEHRIFRPVVHLCKLLINKHNPQGTRIQSWTELAGVAYAEFLADTALDTAHNCLLLFFAKLFVDSSAYSLPGVDMPVRAYQDISI